MSDTSDFAVDIYKTQTRDLISCLDFTELAQNY